MYKSVQKFQKYQLNKEVFAIRMKKLFKISVGKFAITLIKSMENIVVGSKRAYHYILPVEEKLLLLKVNIWCRIIADRRKKYVV